MHVCIISSYIYIYTHTHIYIYMYIYKYVYTYTYVYSHVYNIYNKHIQYTENSININFLIGRDETLKKTVHEQDC